MSVLVLILWTKSVIGKTQLSTLNVIKASTYSESHVNMQNLLNNVCMTLLWALATILLIFLCKRETFLLLLAELSQDMTWLRCMLRKNNTIPQNKETSHYWTKFWYYMIYVTFSNEFTVNLETMEFGSLASWTDWS